MISKSTLRTVVADQLLLDLGGLTPVLWPIYQYDLSIRFSLNIVLGNGLGLSPSLHVTQAPTDFGRMPGLDYPLFTEEGLLLTAVLLLPILYNITKRSPLEKSDVGESKTTSSTAGTSSTPLPACAVDS